MTSHSISEGERKEMEFVKKLQVLRELDALASSNTNISTESKKARLPGRGVSREAIPMLEKYCKRDLEFLSKDEIRNMENPQKDSSLHS